jgi:hypothetical protein
MTKPLIPDPLNSDVEYDRFNHFDIPELDDTQVMDELNYIKALLWGLPVDHWLRERVKALESELSRRRFTTKEKTKALRG